MRSESAKFVGLINQHQVRLGNFIETLVSDYQIAQDLLQNTSLVLWQKRAEFEEGSDFWAWACKNCSLRSVALPPFDVAKQNDL